MNDITAYLLLALSGVLFSVSFLTKKLYRNYAEPALGKRTNFYYMCLSSVIGFITMLAKGGFKLEFEWFSFIMALVYSTNNLLLSYAGIKSFKYANLSVYSMFIMLGSIVMPSAFGILFYNEAFTLMRAVCFVLIFIALFLGVNKGHSDKRAIIYYILIFVLNGMAGILSKAHQSYNGAHVSTEAFLCMSSMVNILFCVVVFCYYCAKEGFIKFPVKGGAVAVGGSVVHTIANYFNIFVLVYIPISVHSVMTTGMTLVTSAVISIISKDKMTKKGIAAVVLAVFAAVLSAL